MRIYKVFGLTLHSNFVFSNHLLECPAGAPSGGTAALPFNLYYEPSPFRLEAKNLVYTSPTLNSQGESVSRLYRNGDREIMSFPSSGEFVLAAEGIDVFLPAREKTATAEINFLGPVLAYWLERSGRPALHASAVGVHGQGFAFVGNHGGGKSSLAAACLAAGCSLITDDLLPLEKVGAQYLAIPGYPQMRMWPEQAAYFLGHYSDLPRVVPGVKKRRVSIDGSGHGDGFGRFQQRVLPLAGIFYPERASTERMTITPMPASKAFIQLITGSISPYIVEATGLQAARMELFSDLLRTVPVYRLQYPTGFENLSSVVTHFLAWIESNLSES